MFEGDPLDRFRGLVCAFEPFEGEFGEGGDGRCDVVEFAEEYEGGVGAVGFAVGVVVGVAVCDEICYGVLMKGVHLFVVTIIDELVEVGAIAGDGSLGESQQC